jgi:hypothetical protein
MRGHTVRFGFAVVIGCSILLGMAACGSDEVQDRDRVKIALQNQALQQMKQDVRGLRRQLAKANRQLARADQAPVSVPTPTYTPSPTPSGGGCGEGVTATGSASCPFALNIAAQYRSSPSSVLYDVYSPVTGQTYDVSCSGSSPVTCTGGATGTATVYFVP